MSYNLSNWDNLLLFIVEAVRWIFTSCNRCQILVIFRMLCWKSNLKSSFTFRKSDLSAYDEQTGSTLQLALNGSVVEDQVVSNVNQRHFK
ncbi:hypothetical protein CS542_00595 [Pedobacter sp. IW39]|nr:hypothetical protein CS542_00595 [Pedobacter sp. IW39]